MPKAPAFSGGGDREDFPNCPAGVFPGVCVDAIDLGHALSQFKNKDGSDKYNHDHAFVFEVMAEDEEGNPALRTDGRPFTVWYRSSFTLNSYNGKVSNLRDFINGWVNKEMDDDTAKGFDTDVMIGRRALVTVKHRTNKAGKTRAFVDSVSPLTKKYPQPDPSGEYTRVQDQPDYAGPPDERPAALKPAAAGVGGKKDTSYESFEVPSPDEDEDDGLPF